MIANEKARYSSVLEKTKDQRQDAARVVEEAAIRAASERLDLELCQGKAAAVAQARTAAVVAARPADVLRLDDELRVARIDVEVATARAAESTTRHTAAVAELHEAEAAVREAAGAVFDAELLDLTAKFTAALDRALAIGAQLQGLVMQNGLNTPISQGLHAVPPAVLAALERLPRPHQLDTPLHILRGGGQRSDAGARRLAELSSQ